MDHEEFQRMDRVRREIRTSAVDLVSDMIGTAQPEVIDVQMVEDFAFEAAEKIITAHAKDVVDRNDPAACNPVVSRPRAKLNGEELEPGEVRGTTRHTGVPVSTPPDEQAILGRDGERTLEDARREASSPPAGPRKRAIDRA